MDGHNRADTVRIDEYVTDNDEVVVRVATYKEGARGHRWIATFNKDALGERSAYFQARKLAATLSEGHGLTINDETAVVAT